ncbi:UNVERIFIED_CONTAM: hypothetical protein Cloal_4152 [Acetivibrio alkalicellulosi]
MNLAAIFDSMSNVKSILKETELFKLENRTRKKSITIDKFSDEFIKISQKTEYDILYKTAMKYGDYDYILTDDSFFQFSCTLNNEDLETGSIRYAYFQNPREYPTYNDFLKENGFSYHDCGDELLFEYEQEIAESKFRAVIYPIRYDYDYKLYKPIHHAISHLHIGHESNIRITLSKIITPEKFVIFVLRNIYRKHWSKAFNNSQEFRELCMKCKLKCAEVKDMFFSEEEKNFLHLK